MIFGQSSMNKNPNGLKERKKKKDTHLDKFFDLRSSAASNTSPRNSNTEAHK